MLAQRQLAVQQTLVVVVVAQGHQARLSPLKLVAQGALALLLFPHNKLPHPPQALQQLQLAAVERSTPLHLLEQSHSEAQHGTFCKSRKRHRHTSYCG